MSFDTIQGIQSSLHSMQAFQQLLIERRNAVQVQRSKLQEFILVGRYFLDNRGGIYQIHCDAQLPNKRKYTFIPADGFKVLPDVMKKNDFIHFIRSRLSPLNRQLVTISCEEAIFPNESEVCDICHEKWTPYDCQDYVVIQASPPISRHLTCHIEKISFANIQDIQI